VENTQQTVFKNRTVKW